MAWKSPGFDSPWVHQIVCAAYSPIMNDIARPESRHPLPPHAKRVFKGEIFDVYQWEQELFDGTKATFEKLVRDDVVTVIPITAAGRIMMTEEEQPGHAPFLSLIGGHVEPGEAPRAAAGRELLEEAGMEAGRLDLWYATQISAKIDYANFVFIARGCRIVAPQRLEAGERIELSEVSFDEFVERIADDRFRNIDVALRVLRALRRPGGIEEIKGLFFGCP